MDPAASGGHSHRGWRLGPWPGNTCGNVQVPCKNSCDSGWTGALAGYGRRTGGAATCWGAKEVPRRSQARRGAAVGCSSWSAPTGDCSHRAQGSAEEKPTRLSPGPAGGSTPSAVLSATLPWLLPRGTCHHLSEEDVDQGRHSSSFCAVSRRAPAPEPRPPGTLRQASGPRGRPRAPPAPRHHAGLAAPPASTLGSALRAREPRGESSLAALAGASSRSRPLLCRRPSHCRPCQGGGTLGALRGPCSSWPAHLGWWEAHRQVPLAGGVWGVLSSLSLGTGCPHPGLQWAP